MKEDLCSYWYFRHRSTVLPLSLHQGKMWAGTLNTWTVVLILTAMWCLILEKKKKRKKCCALDPLAVEEMTVFFSLYFNKHAPDEWMLVKALYTMVS